MTNEKQQTEFKVGDVVVFRGRIDRIYQNGKADIFAEHIVEPTSQDPGATIPVSLLEPISPLAAPDDVVEAVSKLVYEAMRKSAGAHTGKEYDWVQGGNSHIQVEAQSTALHIIKALSARTKPIPEPMFTDAELERIAEAIAEKLRPQAPIETGGNYNEPD